jgi:hypothetical protein
MFSWNYVAATSKHDKSTLRAWVHNEFLRNYLICNNARDYYSNALLLLSKLRCLHYDRHIENPSWSPMERQMLLHSVPPPRRKSIDIWSSWPLELKGMLKEMVNPILKEIGSPIQLREAITLNSNLIMTLVLFEKHLC